MQKFNSIRFFEGAFRSVLHAYAPLLALACTTSLIFMLVFVYFVCFFFGISYAAYTKSQPSCMVWHSAICNTREQNTENGTIQQQQHQQLAADERDERGPQCITNAIHLVIILPCIAFKRP